MSTMTDRRQLLRMIWSIIRWQPSDKLAMIWAFCSAAKGGITMETTRDQLEELARDLQDMLDRITGILADLDR